VGLLIIAWICVPADHRGRASGEEREQAIMEMHPHVPRIWRGQSDPEATVLGCKGREWIMNEQIIQMGPMLVLAGLGAGWLADAFVSRRGYGLLVDMGLGVGANLVGGGVLLALGGLPAGMVTMFGVGLVLAISVIVVQRLGWPCDRDARESQARLRLAELGGPSLGAVGTVSGLASGGEGSPGRPTPTRVLARLATTGIYLLRGVPIEVQRAARIRAAREGTTLRQVLLRGLDEYASGTWAPRSDDRRPIAVSPGVHATGR
jgi:hypothetical protein